MKQYQVAGVVAASVLALGVYAGAQGQGAGQRQGGPPPGAGGGGFGAQVKLPDARKVHITGENPGLQLRLQPNGPIVAEVNYWHVNWSPVGVGHVCYVTTGTGKGPNDLRLAITDNEALARFVTYDTMAKLVSNFADPPYKVVKGTFATEGDTLNERSEICKSPDYTVKATWRKITPGQLGGMQPGNGFTMMFIIDMAAEGEITINGKKVDGSVLPGQGRPPAYLAFAETWLTQ